MTDKIEFQQKMVRASSPIGQVSPSKMASVIYDLIEEKVGAVKPPVQEAPKHDCKCHDISMIVSEVQDAIAGLNEGFKSLNMKIDEIENKIESKVKKIQLKDTK